MSTPPNPIGFVSPTPALDVATEVVMVVEAAGLGASKVVPNPPPRDKVCVVFKPVPKTGTAVTAAVGALAPGSANPVDVVVVVAGVVEVPPLKLNAGAAVPIAGAAKGAIVDNGFANAPNAGTAAVGSAVTAAVGVAPNENPVAGGAAAAEVPVDGAAVMEEANENDGALVVGAPIPKPDIMKV